MPPEDDLPTGGELYDFYLRPLAETPELARVIETNGQTLGVIVVGVDMMKHERAWSGLQDAVLVTDAEGTVILATEPTWRNQSVDVALKEAESPSAFDRALKGAADWAQRTPDARHLLAATAAFAGAFWLLEVCHTDYGGWGMALILLFHLSRGNRLIQLAGLAVFCVASVGGVSIELYALVSLAFIWLYDGRRGYCSRPIQWLCYAFYPVHLLLLWLHARTVDGIWYLT